MNLRKLIILPCLLLILLMLTSCWNYREVNEMAIVIGAAIDKGKTEKYMLTVELLDVSGGQETKLSTRILSVEGETVFDAVRRFILLEGKRGYWGHIRILIISEEIARDDITGVLNFFRQDAETRGDLYVIVSKGYSAREIFNAGTLLGDVLSESLAESLENSIFLAEIPETRLYTISQDLKSNKTAPVLPAITLETIDDNTVPVFCGSAVFRKNRMIDYLDKEETKAMLFLKNEVKEGVLDVKTDTARISLEIKGNNTKIKVKPAGNQIIFDITVETRTVVDEVIGSAEFSELAVLNEIKRISEVQLKEKLWNIIEKARQLRADIFRFGQKLYENDPSKWNEIADDYDTVFANIQVNLNVKIEILNTAVIYKHLNEGE